ncbi:hypothetical protein HTG_14820 [Natrinema mahii]|nr:hypothetical protein HTG_14820 [Natrinema mahii]
MKMNRRNVLVGLGTIVAGGGAALGTGAFSSVEADREVTVNTAGDGSAFLTLNGDGEYVEDDSSDTLTIDLGAGDNGFNEDARTVVEGVVEATNNAADGNGITVGFDDGSDSLTSTTEIEFGDGSDSQNAVAKVTLYWGTEGSKSTQDLSDGDTAKMGAIIDTRDNSNGAGSDGQTTDVTIRAEQQ